ncbi:MAG: glycine cleavage system aminomethyltransferase GcvT [Candidatus Marinimicrobia bacterium]|jgi:aminomethyltransferase|nr:glycine cleavage system aminomethyltransferase GcvT [Gammaproteobacteria bacterium]MBL6911438.1 glycine cleavage system aminomethyltransferase GcvT [Candidatus Neomarinimicrobiota bacterium]MBT3728022.1 glycine cleavage system aminomethyltransferase GcvT [Candidatus Neomarinimicrobiota bacterium]MBT3944236.1 glycine cleavage system aminomethyltransferase GcvT [Candidatus Neomarinimicrobiota bacterium]MBT4111689.1 glycine cleavage system aminomethyltransferase GcvT [Candidatus Neomarinimicrob
MSDSLKTTLYDYHDKLGAKLVPFAGFLMPLQYSGIIDEHKHVRSKVGLFDVSHMGEFIVSGKNAKQFLQNVTINDINALKPGKAQYSALCNESGGILDDLLIYDLSDHYMLVVNASNIEKNFNWLEKHLLTEVLLKDISKDMGLLAIQGPLSRDLLQNFYPDINTLKYYETLMPDSDGTIVARTGYSGELGFEIYISNDKIIDLWNKLLNASDHIRPVGLGCRDSLRLEMGYCLYGHELNELINPIESGLSWITKIDTQFIGSKFLSDITIEKKLVPLVLKDRAIPRADYKIFDDNDNEIGFITSGAMSPSLQFGIALAYIDLPYAKDLNSFNVKIRNNTFTMDKAKLPFYKHGTYLK